jgi:arylsulfatase A-like enzyme
VSLIVRMPPGAGSAGEVRGELLSSVDIRPTLAALAGAECEADIPGRSFAPLLTGEGTYEPREEVFSEKNFHDHYDPIRAIRNERYRYVRNFRPGPNLLLPSDIQRDFPPTSRRPDHFAPRPAEELYDLQADPGEETNLIDRPDLAAVRDDLRARLDRWMESTDDPLLTTDLIPWPAEQFG